jgi:nitrite reductase/ring-hydroxylating ferredoxin subunit
MTAHVVARAVDVPAGARVVVSIEGREIVLANVGGAFLAVRNRCPHQGGPLGEGPITHTVRSTAETGWEPERTAPFSMIRCPWHGLECDLSNGRSPGDARWRVKTYPTNVTADGFVEIIV